MSAASDSTPCAASCDTIDIRLSGYDALFNAWDAAGEGQRELGGELEAFLRERVRAMAARQPVRLTFHLPSGVRDSGRERVCAENIRRHLHMRLAREKRDAVKALWLAIVFLVAGAGLLIARITYTIFRTLVIGHFGRWKDSPRFG